MNRNQSFSIASAALALFALARPAGADQAEKLACIDAHEKVQLLRQKRALREARAELLVCTRDVCPNLVRRECAPWLIEVEASIPSVLLVAQRTDGSDLTNVRVRVDGAPLAEKLDTNAIELDPGEHHFRFEADGFEPVERTVELRPGEKNRRVEATFASPAPAVRPSHRSAAPRISLEPRSNRAPAYLAGGVALVALGSFGFFAVRGRVLESHRADSCAPRCSDSEVRDVRTSYAIADVSLGVAVVSAAVATYFFVRESSSQRSGLRQSPSSALVQF